MSRKSPRIAGVVLSSAALLAAAMAGCKGSPMSDQAKQNAMEAAKTGGVETKPYGTTADGQAVDCYTLTNARGSSVQILTYGGTVTHVMIPDKAGTLGDVVLGFDDLRGYQSPGNPYFGALVGRVANRIAKGTFTIDGTTYHVPVNNPGDKPVNSLHGGTKGYDKRVWSATPTPGNPAGPMLTLKLTDPDGTMGYPGTVAATVVYTWTNDDVLRVQYTATTDKATPVNLTNHSYWNLHDAGKSVVDDQVLKLYADQYLPVDDTQIPTGQVAEVKGTPIDFTTAKPIGRDIEAMGGTPAGYDHCLVTRGTSGQLNKAVDLYDPTTGRTMQMWTDQPGFQMYSGNFLDGKTAGKGGTMYAKHTAVAFEAQAFPDAVNHPSFPNSVLKPGQTYTQLTEYRFGTADKQPF